MSVILISNISNSSNRHDVSRALAAILHSHPFNAFSPVPLNFDVTLDPSSRKRRRGRLVHDNSTGVLTLPTVDVGAMFLMLYNDRGPHGRLQRTCVVGGHRLDFRVSNYSPGADVLERLQRQPYQDSKALEDKEWRARVLSSKSVEVETLQFGRDCRDGVFSIEWEHDVIDKATLSFSDDSKQIRIRIRHDDAVVIIAIRYTLVDAVSAYHTRSGASAIWLNLSAEPLFLIERPSSGVRPYYRQRQPYLPFPGHKRVAPYTSLAMRLVLPTSYELKRFRHLAEVAQLHSVHDNTVFTERRGLYSFYVLNSLHLRLSHLSWPVSFQIEATLKNLLVDAKEMSRLIPRIETLARQHGSSYTARFLKLFRDRLTGWWNRNDVDVLQKTLDACFERALADFEMQSLLPELDSTADPNVFYSHKVTLTATGMQLDGPFPEQSNRALRAYPREHHDCFIRVSFMDDGKVPYRYDRDFDSRGFVRFRVGTALKEGLEVVGKKFEFLAYSLSALKEHTVWFVRPFEYKDKRGESVRVDAATIIATLGRLDHATRYCPARYAARISQAFTATNQTAVAVDAVTYGCDIYSSDDRYCFTDGAGSLSAELADRLWEEMQERKGRRLRSDTPRAFQVRFQGSKGVLSVDHNLTGSAIVLRPSMDKFDAPNEIYVEIAQAFDRPNAYFLNRPLIMVLEGLGVPYTVFEKYQDAAVSDVKASTRDISSTAKLFEGYGLGNSFRASSVLISLSKLGVDHFTGDDFFSRSLQFAVNHVLRDLKTRARIPVPKGITLVGVVDVHDTLKDSEIYACVQHRDGPLNYLEGPVLISRSPVIHPGDVQVAHAIGRPPTGSSFAKEPLPNMVVFSARGPRPLPSCLGGGDLDGDLYNIIPLSECPEFTLPLRLDPIIPASYDPAPKKVLDRESTMTDVADFFVDYINSDVLGLIAKRWMIIADQSPNHIFDEDCMRLSQLHSDAVDYPKSGTPVAVDKIPKSRFIMQPDWNAPETTNASASTTYYDSRRAIGRLFRRIDLPVVDPAIEEARARQRQQRSKDINADNLAEFSLTNLNANPVHSVVRGRVNMVININEDPSRDVRDTVAQLFQYHAGELQGICATHVLSNRRTSTLTEEEVFVGTITEKTNFARKRRDAMASMREQTEYLVRHLRFQLLAREEESLSVALRRSWTAWQLSLAEHKLFGAKTFGWVALGAILDTMREMEANGELEKEDGEL
ncbi:RdRP-domain-containing protein [Peniophora sp. CONT]|nr:RdRP-domain-containing protein [Peniophora sp. CONT]